MAKLNDCWKWINNREIQLLMQRWYYVRERWVFTKKGKAKKRERPRRSQT